MPTERGRQNIRWNALDPNDENSPLIVPSEDLRAISRLRERLGQSEWIVCAEALRILDGNVLCTHCGAFLEGAIRPRERVKDREAELSSAQRRLEWAREGLERLEGQK